MLMINIINHITKITKNNIASRIQRFKLKLLKYNNILMKFVLDNKYLQAD